MAKVVVTALAFKQMDRMPRPIRARLGHIFVRLERWPAVSGVKALSGALAGRYRLRTGAYRLQFRIEGESVIVEKIGHRKGFYED